MSLIHGDCLHELLALKSESVDLIVTDPPYKVITGGMKSGFSSGETNIFSKSKGLLFEHNDIDVTDWAARLFDKLKSGAHAYVFVNSLNIAEFILELKRVGFIHQNVLVWKKNNKNASRTYMKDCEYILFFRKGRHKTIKNASSPTVLCFNNPKPKVHPTEKPIDLLELLISNSSEPGDLVLDPFSGSGTTGIACANLGRRFVGFEKDFKYFEIANARINAAVQAA